MWADLPADLLNVILSKLFGKDRHSFSLVCRHWKTVAETSPFCYSPCLMDYHHPNRTWRFYQYNSFFNMSFPELKNAVIRCSGYGWLLMSRLDDSLFFFDPSNNRKLELPRKNGKGFISLWFFNPPTSPECVVVGVFGINTDICQLDAGIYTFNHGDNEWETGKYPFDDIDFWLYVGPAILQGGLIYFLSIKGDVAILDIQNELLDIKPMCLTFENDPIGIAKQYLVKVNGEEALLAVFVYVSREVSVFRLSPSNMKWDLVESLGDKVLYLSHTSSFGYKAHTKCMENTIYFPNFCGDSVVFYSLNDAEYHSLDQDYSEINARSLHRLGPAIRWLDRAAWIMLMPPMEVGTNTISLSWL